MTQPTEPTTTPPADSAPESDTTPPEQQDNPSREAAKYRTRLRAAEAERDQYRDLLAATRQGIVERAATAAGIAPKLFTAAGIDVDTLLDENGHIDHGRLSDTLEQVRIDFGVPRKPQPDSTLGVARDSGKPAGTWQGLVQDAMPNRQAGG